MHLNIVPSSADKLGTDFPTNKEKAGRYFSTEIMDPSPTKSLPTFSANRIEAFVSIGDLSYRTV